METIKVVTKVNGVREEHSIADKTFSAIVHQGGIKVDVPDAFEISPATTVARMRGMSQMEWKWVAESPMFQHFFTMLFKHESIVLPAEVKVLCEDYDEGVVHACGLIVCLVEAMFRREPRVFLRTPETHLHPAVVARLTDVILAIQKLANGEGNGTQAQKG